MTPRLDWEGDLPLRYDFASDNVAGAMPEAIEALVAANTGFAAGYGADHVGRRAADLIRQMLDADAAVPREWTPESQKASNRVLRTYGAEHGPMGLQQALSGGQYRHAKGVFYGGSGPSWARRTQEAIYRSYLSAAGRIAIIDYHTGLGPWGYAEPIMSDPVGSAAHDRGLAWFGATITTPLDGSSTSAETAGDNLTMAPLILSHAEVTGVALEYGVQSLEEVFLALRSDAWLHAYGDPASPEGQAIKALVRNAFYGDADDWKGMVIGQSLTACRQAIAGLKRG